MPSPLSTVCWWAEQSGGRTSLLTRASGCNCGVGLRNTYVTLESCGNILDRSREQSRQGHKSSYFVIPHILEVKSV